MCWWGGFFLLQGQTNSHPDDWGNSPTEALGPGSGGVTRAHPIVFLKPPDFGLVSLPHTDKHHLGLPTPMAPHCPLSFFSVPQTWGPGGGERVGSVPTLGFAGTKSPPPPQLFLRGSSRPLPQGHNPCPAQSFWTRTKMVSRARVSVGLWGLDWRTPTLTSAVTVVTCREPR